MKERGIIFSAPMIRAILDGRKTKTRRIVKPEPFVELGVPCWKARQGIYVWRRIQNFDCPYGSPGDRLWVRESFNGASYGKPVTQPDQPSGTIIRYYANDRHADFPNKFLGGQQGKKRPSIHMPRWASRITLEIEAVKVEMLQEISRGDAMEEGCPFPNMAKGPDTRQWFKDLWESIHGPGSWERNDWCWVIEFRRLP